jgi:hypothetical protein
VNAFPAQKKDRLATVPERLDPSGGALAGEGDSICHAA